MILSPGTPADPDAPISKLLTREEGVVLHAYQDTLGYWTIGIGSLIDKRKGGGITLAEAYLLLGNRLATFEFGLDEHLAWWRHLDPVRRDVVLAMAYQMGLANLLEFRSTLTAIRNGVWNAAATGMRASLWYEQTPERAERMAQAMGTGTLSV